MEQTNPSAEHPTEDKIDFFGYVASLAFQAMIFLGEIANPLTGKIEKNPEQAKLLIDTLILLREKTKGNVTEAEQGLLDSSIYELQLKYVQGLQSKV